MFNETPSRFVPVRLVAVLMTAVAKAAVNCDSEAGLKAGHRFAHHLQKEQKVWEKTHSILGESDRTKLDGLIEALIQGLRDQADLDIEDSIDHYLDKLGGDEN